jgi:hypothetical protein
MIAIAAALKDWQLAYANGPYNSALITPHRVG